jgi:hypothetical protein
METTIATFSGINFYLCGDSAIQVLKSNVIFSNLLFENNTADVGAAVYVDGSSEVLFLECEFNYNTAELGGALYLSPGSISSFNNSFFTFNSATSTYHIL